MSQQIVSVIRLVALEVREWYQGDTILIDKNGLSGTVTNVGTTPFNENTILVDKNGLSGTTTEIAA